jgi:hypothetical protein
MRCERCVVGCLKCNDGHSCHECNTIGGWARLDNRCSCDSKRGFFLPAASPKQCQCQAGFLANVTDGVTTCHSCEEKFGAGCLDCTEFDKCTKCDTLKGWIHTKENKCACNWDKDLVYRGGKCACKGNMYLNPQDGKCTAPDCGIGCVDCISKGVCKKCNDPDGWRVNDHEKCECSKFRWMLPSADGKECLCKPKTWREDIRGWKICRACMHGCLDCTSLGDCTKCDAKAAVGLVAVIRNKDSVSFSRFVIVLKVSGPIGIRLQEIFVFHAGGLVNGAITLVMT